MIEGIESVNGIYQIVEKKPVTFIFGDNMALLRYMREELMRGYFHLGIVDPPYGIDVTKMNLGATKDSKPRKYERGNWDGEVPTREYWRLLRYVCRNLIVWGGNYFSNYIPPGRCFVVWDKKNDNISFAVGELALTTFDANSVIIRRPRNTNDLDDQSGKRHDTQKPVYLYDKLHLDFVGRGQRVLDTHGGSFTHAIAAYKNNVNLTIIEKQESYFKSGLQAYENASQKGRLMF